MIGSALLLTVLSQSYYTPQEANTLFSQANEAYYKEDYSSAKASYLKLLSHGYGGADVLYNLGTTCLAQDDLGEAVLYLERAKRVSSQSDVDANLAFARSKQLDQVIGAQMDPPLIQRLANATSPEVFGSAFLAFWTAGFGLLCFLRLYRGGRRVPMQLTTGLVFACAVGFALVFATHAIVRETVTEAVVLPKTLSAREFPKETAKASFEVHAGLKVRLLEDAGKFVRIRLPNGLEGWADKDSVARI